MMLTYRNPLILAVTGGIGSGQSTVCSYFAEWGCKVISADDQAKQLIATDKTVQDELRQEFGKSIFLSDGRLDNKRLSELAFKDELHTQRLNQLVHPRMVSGIVEEMEEARFSGRFPAVVIDAALIYELSIEQMFDAVIAVDAPLTLRQERVILRDKMNRKQFAERVDKQIPLEEKVKWADYVIENDGTPEELKIRARKVYDSLFKATPRRPRRQEDRTKPKEKNI
jgi:dephospho-CoA kinase